MSEDTEKSQQGMGYLIIIGAALLAAAFTFVFFDYELKKGAVACTTEDALVRVRGGSLFGTLTAAMVVSQNDCVIGKPTPVKALYPIWAPGSLARKITISGKTYYADKNKIQRR